MNPLQPFSAPTTFTTTGILKPLWILFYSTLHRPQIIFHFPRANNFKVHLIMNQILNPVQELTSALIHAITALGTEEYYDMISSFIHCFLYLYHIMYLHHQMFVDFPGLFGRSS